MAASAAAVCSPMRHGPDSRRARQANGRQLPEVLVAIPCRFDGGMRCGSRFREVNRRRYP